MSYSSVLYLVKAGTSNFLSVFITPGSSISYSYWRSKILNYWIKVRPAAGSIPTFEVSGTESVTKLPVEITALNDITVLMTKRADDLYSFTLPDTAKLAFGSDAAFPVNFSLQGEILFDPLTRNLFCVRISKNLKEGFRYGIHFNWRKSRKITSYVV